MPFISAVTSALFAFSTADKRVSSVKDKRCDGQQKEKMVLEEINVIGYLSDYGDSNEATNTREPFYAEFGRGSTFPQVIIAGHKMGGCTETVKYLRENTYL